MKENISEILAKYDLKEGKHKSLDDGACVMELVSYIAGEPWTDRPKCACPVLTSYAIRYNDRVDDAQRQKLKEVIPLLLNSRNEGLQLARGKFLALKAVTVFLPVLTEALELGEITSKLKTFTLDDFKAAREYIDSVKSQIREAARKKAAADAYDAYAAAAAAAYDAAKNKTFWLELKQKIWDLGLEALKEACELKLDSQHKSEEPK